MRGSEEKAKAQVLTVHVSFMLILDEGITTGFSRALTVYHVYLQGRQKAVSSTSYRAAPPTPQPNLGHRPWAGGHNSNRFVFQESQGTLIPMGARVKWKLRGHRSIMWEAEGPAKQVGEGYGDSSMETECSDGGDPQMRP